MCLWLCLSPEVAVRCGSWLCCHLKWRSGVCSWLCLSPEVMVRCVRDCVCHLKWRSGVFVTVFVT